MRCDGEGEAGWLRGGPGTPAPAGLWPRQDCHSVELRVAEPENLDKRRRCPRGRQGGRGCGGAGGALARPRGSCTERGQR